MKVFLWIVAVLASGGVGFYYGFGRGAETLGTIAAQNSVSNGVALVRNSLDALAQDESLTGAARVTCAAKRWRFLCWE